MAAPGVRAGAWTVAAWSGLCCSPTQAEPLLFCPFPSAAAHGILQVAGRLEKKQSG